MRRCLNLLLNLILAVVVNTTAGCGDGTNSIEMPANPEPAPGSPSAVGTSAPAIGTANDHQQD
jgi:hypothetical protein